MSANTNKTNWEKVLIEEVKQAVINHEFWQEQLALQGIALHLAVLVEPYLQYILDGQKTVESRFSVNRCPPYQRVQVGDVVLLKKAAGPVVGLCQVSSVWYYELEPSSWHEIKTGFAKALCAQDPTFWKDRETASFATLLQIQHVTPINPVKCMKRDRRGWVVLPTGLVDTERKGS